jgi:hypothetical protein
LASGNWSHRLRTGVLVGGSAGLLLHSLDELEAIAAEKGGIRILLDKK